jgi:AcrR family transcriptional regulator
MKGVATAPQSPAQPADELGRKERILVAAAALVSQSGYHAVSMGEIGAAAGITGPGIYRHFESKSAVLVALFDRAIDGLLRVAESIALRDMDPESALHQLIASQVRFVLADRSVAQVYYTENQSLPEVDQRRLRRKQRLYLEEWVHPLLELRPRLDETEARVVVHAAIGAIQSSLFHTQVPAGDHLDRLLGEAAEAVLDLPRSDGGG